jgi:hypothetical protein
MTVHIRYIKYTLEYIVYIGVYIIVDLWRDSLPLHNPPQQPPLSRSYSYINIVLITFSYIDLHSNYISLI